MKTLKKTLCLVLAVVMAVGVLVLPASAADETTVDVTKYNEAVQVVNGLDILRGDDNGDLLLSKEVSRAEAITLVARLALLPSVADDYPTGTFSFTDCESVDWAKSAIAYGEDQGIVAGIGGGKFDPDRTVTGLELAKMILCAAGYDANTEGMTGDSWEGKTQTLARKVGLNTNLGSLNAKTPLVRAQVAQMLFNALTVNHVQYSGGNITVGDVSINTGDGAETTDYSFAELFGLDSELNNQNGKITLKPETGVITGNAANVAGADGKKTVVGTDTTYGVTTGSELLNHYVEIYVADNNKNNVVAVVDKSSIVEVSADDSSKITDKATWEKKFGTGVTVSSDIVKPQSVTITENSTAPAGTYVLNGKSIVAFIAPVQYALGQVTKIVTTSGKETITVKEATSSATTTLTYKNDAEKDEINEYEGIAKDDYVLVSKNGNVTTVMKAETVQGAPAKIDQAKVTINGTVYDKSSINGKGIVEDELTGNFLFTEEYTLYLDNTGKNYAAAAVVKSDDDKAAGDLVYVVYAFTNSDYTSDEWGDNATNTSYFVQAVNSNGEEVIFQTEDNKFGGITGAIAGNEITGHKLYTVKTSYDADDDVEYATFTDASQQTTVEGGSRTNKAVRIAPSYYYASDVKFIYVDGSKDKLDVEVKNGVQAISTEEASKVYYVGAQVGTSDNYSVKYVFIGKALEEDITGTGIMYLTSKTSTSQVPYTAANGKPATGYEFTAYIDGVKTDIIVASKGEGPDVNTGVSAPGFVKYTVKDDIYTITGTNTDAIVKTNVKITNMFNGLLSSTESQLTDIPVTDAVVVDLLDHKALGDDDVVVPEDATELTSEYTVALVLNTDKNAVVTVYVTGYAPAKAE